ncbi:hypothetical protein WJX74_009597 [Apatococcus lobatus]|uniref:AP2/ERF domain-containing protein n=1 Tax=Apatococcus lobatus TaxID=904363 RepID=A0AAW1QMG3_9CHLO
MQRTRRAAQTSFAFARNVQDLLKQAGSQATEQRLLCSGSADSWLEQSGLKPPFASCSFFKAVCHLAVLQQAPGSSKLKGPSREPNHVLLVWDLDLMPADSLVLKPQAAGHVGALQFLLLNGLPGSACQGVSATWEVLHQLRRLHKHATTLPSATRYRRVHFVPKSTKWVGDLTQDFVKWSCGFWPSPEQAAEAYDRAAICIQRPDEKLNFPDRYSHLERRLLQESTIKVVSDALRKSATARSSRAPLLLVSHFEAVNLRWGIGSGTQRSVGASAPAQQAPVAWHDTASASVAGKTVHIFCFSRIGFTTPDGVKHRQEGTSSQGPGAG